jgi:Spx/MgsR family transcriptional regulator
MDETEPPRMSVRIYGIRNCDTMKKAFAWLAEHRIAFDFHDYRKDGVASDRLAAWCEVLGWEPLINTRGTTWKRLDPAGQSIDGINDAIALMTARPSVIRRPVLETGSGELLIGFDPARYAGALKGSGAPA